MKLCSASVCPFARQTSQPHGRGRWYMLSPEGTKLVRAWCPTVPARSALLPYCSSAVPDGGCRTRHLHGLGLRSWRPVGAPAFASLSEYPGPDRSHHPDGPGEGPDRRWAQPLALGKAIGRPLQPRGHADILLVGEGHSWDACFYSMAQFLGGLAGVLLTAALLGQWVADPAVDYAVTVPGGW
jgi:hypothetical protein